MFLSANEAPPVDPRPWYEQALDVIPAVLQYQQQRDITKLNTKLIEQGKNPVSGSLLAPTVNFGLSPEMTQLVTIGVVGGLAVLVYRSMKRRR